MAISDLLSSTCSAGDRPVAVEDRSFFGFGGRGQVVVVGGEAARLADVASERLERLEELWTRFSATSDVARLHARPGLDTVVADETRVLLRTLVEAWRLSGGRCDASVLGVLLSLGGATSRTDPTRRTVVASDVLGGPAPGLAGVVMDDRSGTARLPLGVGIDPGATGKGLAADMVVEELLLAGADGAMVNLGGDLRVAGTAPDGRGWTVGLVDPRDPGADLATVALCAGGVATSMPRSRTFGGLDDPVPHVIDPALGRPIESSVLSVTVLAGAAWRAEAIATAALVGSTAHARDALAVMTGHGVDGLVVDAGGHLHRTPGFDSLLVGAVRQEVLR